MDLPFLNRHVEGNGFGNGATIFEELQRSIGPQVTYQL